MEQNVTDNTQSHLLTWWQGGDRYAENISADGILLDFPFNGPAIHGKPIWNQLRPDIKLCPVDFNKFFLKNQPLNFEIGIGNGEFLEKYATDVQTQNWLGVEVFKQVFKKAESRAIRSQLDNIKIIQFDAALILRLIPDGTLNSVYVNFPDPWPKSAHKRRRLLKTPFINLIVSKLQPEGLLHIATDHEDYAKEICKNISKVEGISSVFSNIYERNVDDYFPTKYYKKFATKTGAFFFRYKKDLPKA